MWSLPDKIKLLLFICCCNCCLDVPTIFDGLFLELTVMRM